MVGAVPLDRVRDCGLKIPDWPPAKGLIGLVNTEAQELCFVHAGWVATVYPISRPVLEGFNHKIFHGAIAVGGWSKVERSLC